MRSRTVLVIEDSPDGREALRLMLECWGYRVEVAADGLEGIEKALALVPDTVIADIGLPILDGYRVAAKLRVLLGNRVLLIALTSYGQAEDVRRALAAGFDLHLTKPADPETLASILRGSRRGRQQASISC